MTIFHSRRALTALPLLCALLLICAATVTVAATPRPAPVATQPGGAAPFPIASLPEAWGKAQLAKRPVTVKSETKRPSGLVPLPAPKRLSRMPIGRIQVGEGRVDPARQMRHPALYVVKAQAAGIVEYLYDAAGTTRTGMPLVRVYDPAILTDLRIGESAMSRFVSSPFIIAGRSTGMPPVPPTDFPRPTAMQRLLGWLPRSQSLPAPTPRVPQAPLAAEPVRSGLTRVGNLTPQPEPQPVPETPAPTLSTKGVTRLSGQLSDAHDRMSELSKSLAALEDQISAKKDQLAEAREDCSARERLYNQGVLARNVYEGAKARVGALQDELEGLQHKRSETAHAREAATQRLGSLQEQMDEEMAQRANASATMARREPDPPSAATPLARPTPRRAATTPLALTRPAAASAESWFPSPTRQARPELSRLPRLAGPGLRVAPELPSVPLEAKRLSDPRWVDQAAPGDGVVVRRLAPEGAQVQPGTPLLEIADREWARVYSDVPQSSLGSFPQGAPVRVSFDNYPGVTLEGFINDRKPLPGTELARVEMVVMAREGYCPDDTYASLEWLVLAAPIVESDRPEPATPAIETVPGTEAGRSIYDLLPLVPSSVGPGQDPVASVKADEYVGVLRLGEVGGQALAPHSKPQNSQRLASLRQWRDSFTAGMTTGIFGNLVLTYPRDNEVGKAVERMATAQVSHDPNRCARTMREALGWGLGDAAMWMDRLPERGYKPRLDGLARPGDILVWPFTYGPRRNQHIGVAVSQGGKLMLLSNLSGTLGTTELLGGYVAFYKPSEQAAKLTVKPPKPYLVLKQP